jgi:enoyl-CoA hydratase
VADPGAHPTDPPPDVGTESGAASHPEVAVDVADGVAVVTLDAPERRNALTPAMVAALTEALDAVEGDEGIGAVVVTGRGRAFCAGADLAALAEVDRPGLLGIYEAFLRVGRCSLPTLAAVNGPAVGAGLNLALSCDVVVAGRAARFDSRFLQLGLGPGGGHSRLLHQAVGPGTAAAMVLFGEVLDGEAAARAGLAQRCVDDDELLAEARRWAGRAASVPRELLRRTKANLRAASEGTEADAIERELATQLWSMAEPAFAERLATLRTAVASKPPPA